MVGLCVDVLWMVVWLSVRAVGAVCKVEGDVQVVNTFDCHRHLRPYKRHLLPLQKAKQIEPDNVPGSITSLAWCPLQWFKF